MPLPNQLQINLAAGSQWTQGYQLQNDDGTPMDISGFTFEMVIRPSASDHTEAALVAVNSTTSNAQGSITVDVDTATLLVVLSPTATTLLGQGANVYALWMDPGDSDATALVVGICFSQLIAAA